MKLMDMNAYGVALKLGRKRQTIERWLKVGATIEVLDDGRISVFTEREVHPAHEPQVRG